MSAHRVTSDRDAAESLAAAAARLLPGSVLSAASHIDGTAALTHDAERALVERAVAKRKHEFAAGRALAHVLISRLGGVDEPLVTGKGRAPAWPKGLVGSISHGAGLCVVAVASQARCSALGLDVEDAAPLKQKLWRHVLRDEEQAELAGLSDDDAGRRAKLAFSAKECFYKALWPRLTRVLNFEDVRLSIADDGSFTGELLVDDAGLVLDAPLQGSWERVGDVVLSTVALSPVSG